MDALTPARRVSLRRSLFLWIDVLGFASILSADPAKRNARLQRLDLLIERIRGQDFFCRPHTVACNATVPRGECLHHQKPHILKLMVTESHLT
jgi:hypothetical protein